MGGKKEQIAKVLKQFTPDQQAFTQHVAELKVQNKLYERQLGEMKSAYDNLFKVMIVLLHVDPDHELRIHKSQFLRFKDEYRIQSEDDEKTGEFVLKLKTLTDD